MISAQRVETSDREKKEVILDLGYNRGVPVVLIGDDAQHLRRLRLRSVRTIWSDG